MGKQKTESEPFAGLVRPNQQMRIFLKNGRAFAGIVLNIKDGWIVFEDVLGQVSILDTNAVFMLTEGYGEQMPEKKEEDKA